MQNYKEIDAVELLHEKKNHVYDLLILAVI